MVNIRSAVWFTEELKCGSAVTCLALKNLRTAPDWICGGNPKVITESPKGRVGAQFTQHNVDISQSCYKDGLIRLFQQMKARGIPTMPEVKFVILHGPGDSKGEEWQGKQTRTTTGRAAMRALVDEAWVSAFSPDGVWKLGWPKATVNVAASEDLFYHCRKVGCGQRNSNTENWMIHFPKPELGQTMVDANGKLVDSSDGAIDVHLRTDESNVFIRENRHFQDQNEEYQGWTSPPEKFVTTEFFPLRYRQAALAMLHVRRNIYWAEPDSHMNPQLLSWASLQLGKSAGNAPDAWIQLMQTHRQAFGKSRRINNLERWLYQRDLNGSVTKTTARQNHSDPLRLERTRRTSLVGHFCQTNSITSIWLALARRSASLLTTLMSGGPHEVAIKVTYLDKGTQSWSLAYTDGNGDPALRTIKNSNTGGVRTATFFIRDFVANAKGYDFDFALESPAGDTPFMFVRLIRLKPGSDAAVPAAPKPPQDLGVGP